ncbi:MAG: ATP-binding protein [Cytophagales bacterium]|nr:ATP-binding protein [Armatimonadota bacterium]
MRANPIGVVGSPSDTTEITIDILESAEAQRIRGQMVYLVLPHDGCRIAVIGQISRVETQNRWHQDMAFRGIIKRQGSLPHLSERADVRTATLTVQAAFTIDVDERDEEFCREDMLGTSPGTGARVYAVRDEVLSALLERHKDELVYLGNVFGTPVKMPFSLRHFGKGAGGAGEAYHIGVFGKTGSGKSGLAAYVLLAYARHKQMGLLFIVPQGQFSSDRDLPFPLHLALRRAGREVRVYKLATQVRLREDASQFAELLRKANFYRFVGIKNPENQEIAVEVVYACVRKALTEAKAKIDTAPADLMRTVLTLLVEDSKALERIYTGKERREQLAERFRSLLSDPDDFRDAEILWQTALDLFQKVDSKGNERTPLWNIVSSLIAGASETDSQPIVFLDISGEGTAFKDDEEIKALLLKEIATALDVEGGKAFQQGRRLNCLVALDEAHRYVRAYTRGDDASEMAQLTKKFVDAVRTTRKYGLGYMFITQTLASLHREIIGQLRLNAFGFGLTMGSELGQLEEIVGDPEALSLYKSFVDPQSNRQFPFMFTGPASPLSFTGMPLFVQMFTKFDEFAAANPFVGGSGEAHGENGNGTVPVPFTTSNGFESVELFQKTRSADFD